MATIWPGKGSSLFLWTLFLRRTCCDDALRIGALKEEDGPRETETVNDTRRKLER